MTKSKKLQVDRPLTVYGDVIDKMVNELNNYRLTPVGS
jgi:hypothetical protein